MKLKILLWYLGVLVAAAVLIAGIFSNSWSMTLIGFILAMSLKVTNKYIPLPKIYEKMGVKNEVFEGKVDYEKNN